MTLLAAVRTVSTADHQAKGSGGRDSCARERGGRGEREESQDLFCRGPRGDRVTRSGRKRGARDAARFLRCWRGSLDAGEAERSYLGGEHSTQDVQGQARLTGLFSQDISS